MPETKAFRINGPMSSPLQIAEESTSWSSLSAESPFSATGATLRRVFVDCIVDEGSGGNGDFGKRGNKGETGKGGYLDNGVGNFVWTEMTLGESENRREILGLNVAILVI